MFWNLFFQVKGCCCLIFNDHTHICIILIPESVIEAANELHEVRVTYEPQGPLEVSERQKIPSIPEAKPPLQ